MMELGRWTTRFPMVLYVCPACGDIFRLPAAAAPLWCQGTEGIDQHDLTEALRFEVVPVSPGGEGITDEQVERAASVLHERTRICDGADTCAARELARAVLRAALGEGDRDG